MKKKLIFGLMLAATANMAHADWLGVEDVVLIEKAVQQLDEMKKQIDVAKKTYDQARAQYDNAKNQLDTVNNLRDLNKGHSGFGDLNNKLKDMEQLKWSADNWRDALNGKGNSAEYARLIQEYKKNHPDVTKNLKKSAVYDTDEVKQLEHTAKITEAAGVQSEYAYNDINKSIERIHKLSEQIEKADSTKAALDLNSRLIAELAYLQTQNIKAQTLANQQLSQKQSLELSRGMKSSQFLIDPDENK